MSADAIKQMLTYAGRWSSPRTMRRLDFFVSYMEVGRWMYSHGFWPVSGYSDRPTLFDSIFEFVGGEAILYLEFGVYRGYSMRLWSEGLKNPDAQLIGFDSFEGLPEDWHADASAGRFDTGGQTPMIDDSRVSFVKGWFDAVLPTFNMPSHDRLVVNLDADIYSSTKYVLDWLTPHIRPGDILYFDEFFDRTQELRAFDEFLKTTNMRFALLGATSPIFRTAGVVARLLSA
jgi:Macrocin-O-methyltransferase (TylF)